MKNTVAAPERHRWLDEWLSARGPALKTLVADALAMVAADEQETGARKRARRADDQRAHETAVEVLVANLAYEVVAPKTGAVAVVVGNGERGFTRYDNRAFGKPFARLVYRIVELGLADWGTQQKRGGAWPVAPTDAFAVMVQRAGVTGDDFGRMEGREVIVLTEKRPFGSGTGKYRLRTFIDYPETPETTAMREDVQALNAFLAAADITFVDDGEGEVDTNDRLMRRHFVMPKGLAEGAPVPFDRCGRLYGGFWQNLPSRRRANIRIDGEPVASLDYGQMGARLAYAHVGAMPPEGDIYAVPGLEGHREAVKRALNCLLTDDYKRRKWPKKWAEEEDDLLPEAWTVARTKAAILIRHPALRPCIGIGLGLRTMYRESEVMVSVLRGMMERGIVGLGIHDGLLVKASRMKETRALMVETARSTTSTDIPVACSPLSI